MKSLYRHKGYTSKSRKLNPSPELQRTPSTDRSSTEKRQFNNNKSSSDEGFKRVANIIPDFRATIRSSSSPYLFQSVLPPDFETFYSLNETGEKIHFEPPYKGAELTKEQIDQAKQSSMMTREIIDRIRKALTYLRNHNIKTISSSKIINLSNDLNLIYRMEGFFTYDEIREIKDWIGLARVNVSLKNAFDIVKSDTNRFDLALIKGLLDDVDGSLTLPQYLTREEYQILLEYKEKLKHLFFYKNSINVYQDYLRNYVKFLSYSDQKLIDRYAVLSALLKNPGMLSRMDFNNFNLLKGRIGDVLYERGVTLPEIVSL